ncbi:hypothetical protein [Acinetobacter sp.]|uniref:hypothetical protein n=1 Tax=Acinetobacter sp. TaxID=472 RepID=UPI00375233E4
MEKNGEFREEQETDAAKKTQKEIYTPIEKTAFVQIQAEHDEELFKLINRMVKKENK